MAVTVGVNILDPTYMPITIGTNAQHAAARAQLEVSRRQCFRNRRERWIPLVVDIGAEPVAPRGVLRRRAATIGNTVDTNRDRVGMQIHGLGGGGKQLAETKRAQGRRRIRAATRDESAFVVPRH